MRVAKEVICGALRDVEKIGTEDFERNGYRVLQVLAIDDLGHDGRRRSWRMTAEVERIDGRAS